MKCCVCDAEDTRVVDSRSADDGRAIRRRRACSSCGERFTTFESAVLVMPRIIKRDQNREPFDEAKLRSGIVRSLDKRPVSMESIEGAVERVIHTLQTAGEREISSRLVGEMVMEELRNLDEVAYVRFASVYRSFEDVTDFQDEVNRLRALSERESRRNQMSLLPDDDD